jgi:sigma-54 dependent transcriptional regulator, acetoin dehydrogenase operon transcriptional activator AcoR
MNHSDRIVALTRNKIKVIDPVEALIIRSWERCLDSYRLDPEAKRHQPIVIERQTLTDHQDQVTELLGDFVQEEMALLYQRIASSGHSVILTDRNGIILNYVGDPALSQQFAQAGLRPGAVWSEKEEGTNGIGTCLHEKQPITICREEHFRAQHTQLTCSASPIFDSQGELLAILDVSTLNSRDSKQIHQHTAALVRMSAKLIENLGFLRQWRHQWILRFHSRAEYVGHVGEGLIVVNENGQILASNQNALTQLGLAHRDALLQRSLTDVFNTPLSALIAWAGRQANHVCLLQELAQGRSYYALLRTPQFPTATAILCRQPAHVSTTTLSNEVMTAVNETYTCINLANLAGRDPRMAANMRYAQKVMNKGIAILLQGETGTGKEALAKSIHEASQRANKPFVALNCAAIPESLIESELFGYKHGAFTGARREGMRGKILQSHEGTLFLDEIGDMPLALQTRLLRVLEEREVLPLGCEQAISVKLNIISATHHQLGDLIASGKFREDLYYRLNGITLSLPPLRERTDLDHLIRCVLAMENSDGQAVHISSDAFELLLRYDWPGNIRQLRNVLRTALALCTQQTITVEDLPTEMTGVKAFDSCQWIYGSAKGELPLTGVQVAVDTPIMESVDSVNQDNVLKSAERSVMLQELERHRWNITNTAASLKMSRNTLYRKMKKHGIALPSTH